MRLMLIMIVILFGLTEIALGGGPDVRAKNVTVDKVISDNAKIVMIVTGRCELFVSDFALPAEKGNAKFVATEMRNCVVTILRRDHPGSGYDNWEAHCKSAESLMGKSAWMDLQGSITIDHAMVAAVRAEASAFGHAIAAEDARKR